MGTTRLEFWNGDLRCVGGDYGQIHLEGTTEEARRTLEQIVAAVRHGGDRFVGRLVVDLEDPKAAFLETRHAGRSGETQFDFVGPGTEGSSGTEGMAEGANDAGALEGGA